MNWPRTLGASLIAVGTLLCTVYLVPTVYGAAMAHLAVAQFRAQSPAHRLWDSARVKAYQRSLTASFAAPEAILRIPRVGVEVPVLEGTSDLTLNRGVGHIAATALPGQPGNLAISGHRDGFFRPLKDVIPGDHIDLEHGQTTDHYIVQSMKVVSPSDTSVLAPSGQPTLTLVTCYPFYFIGSAPQRYVVRATLQASEPISAQVGYHVPPPAPSQLPSQMSNATPPRFIPSVPPSTPGEQ